jgi:hypothetical protein
VRQGRGASALRREVRKALRRVYWTPSLFGQRGCGDHARRWIGAARLFSRCCSAVALPVRHLRSRCFASTLVGPAGQGLQVLWIQTDGRNEDAGPRTRFVGNATGGADFRHHVAADADRPSSGRRHNSPVADRAAVVSRLNRAFEGVPPAVPPDDPASGNITRHSRSHEALKDAGQQANPAQSGTSDHAPDRAHNPKVAGSNPAPATNEIAGQRLRPRKRRSLAR